MITFGVRLLFAMLSMASFAAAQDVVSLYPLAYMCNSAGLLAAVHF